MATQRSELNVVVSGKDELSPTLSKLETNIIRAVGAISAALAGIKIAAAPITAAATFQRELAEVAKTTGFAATEIDTLSKNLLDMSLRIDVTATDLAKIAAAAGQQGLGREGVAGIVQFTDSVARMSSVLDVTAEDAANNIGKIANIFKIPLSDIERAVSTFNEVSNNSTASGEELLDVVRRIGDAAGSLNLKEATALAATGLDFGQSPEVVGTAYAKVFSSMFEKADEFAALMGKGSTEWLDTLQHSGIDAYKQFLDKLRKLDAQSRQKAIVDLVGGGRIGALINKQVQDTTDSVLNRNLASADTGQAGVSALKEQSTVLDTLVAQVKILSNSFFKLGADASKQLLAPLTAYAAQLTQTLQSDGAKAALGEIMGAVKDLIDTLVSAVKFVASLNVNWSNFIQLAKVFAGVKLAQALGGMIANLSGLSNILKSTSTDAAATAKAITATGAAAEQSGRTSLAAWIAQKAGIAEAIQFSKNRKAAVEAETQALRDQIGARILSERANSGLAAQQARTSTLEGRASTAGANAQAQRAALQRAEQDAANARIAAQTQAAARVAQAEQANQARLLQIQQDYEARYAAIKATGTQTGLKAARAQRAQEITDQEAFHARSLRSIEQYQARRLAAVEAAGLAEINREKALLMQRLGTYDAVTTKLNSQRAVTGAAQAAASTAASGFSASTTALTAATAAANIAKNTFTTLGVVVRTVAGIFSFAARAFLGIAGWVTILYSVADAFGLVDKAAPFFTKLTDAIGLTSKAMRDKQVANRAEEASLKEQLRVLEDLTKTYKAYQNAQTGQIDTSKVAGRVSELSTGATAETKQNALSDLNKVLEGARATEENFKKIGADTSAALVAQQQKLIADAQAQIAQAGVEKVAAIARFPNQAAEFTAAYTAQIAEFQAKIDAANKKILDFNKSVDASGANALKAANDFKAAAEPIASAFTPESAKALATQVLEVAKARQKVNDLQNEYTKNEQATKTTDKSDSRNEKEVQANIDSLKEQLAALASQQKILQDLEDKTRAFANAQANVKGLDPKVAQSYRDLLIYMQQPLQAIENLIKATQAVDPSKLTGQNVGVAGDADKKGTEKYVVRNEGAERRLEKARLALARARIQAENALADENSKQLLATEEDYYEKGLRGLDSYYNARAALQLAANQRDIQDKKAELDEANKSAGRSTGADKVQFETQAVKLQGDIKVLEAQRNGILDENARALRDASKQFKDKIRESTIKAMTDGLLPATAGDIFKNQLAGLESDYQVFLNQLTKAGDEASLKLAAALRDGFKIESAAASMTPFKNSLDLIYAEIGRMQQRFELQRQDGLLTTQQAEAAYTAEIQRRIPVLREQIQLAEKQLGTLKGLENTQGYKQQAAAIDDLKLQLEELSSQTNKTAKGINQEITNSVASAIGELRKYGASAKEVFANLLLSISDSILRIFEQQFAERLIKAIGSGGAGGIGGFFQQALQGSKTDSTSAVGVAGQAASGLLGIGAPDGSLTKPFYTLPAPDPAGAASDLLGGGDDEKEGIAALFDKVTENNAEKDTDIVSALGDLGGSFSSDVGGLGSSLSSGFGSIVSTILSAIQSVIAFLAAQATADATSSAVSSVASVAHSGGKVGSSPLRPRKVNPAIFANARRYHEGGLVAGEVPAILQTGERVLNRQQTAAYDKGIGQGGSSGEIGIRNVLVVDPNFVPDSMTSSQGERVVITHIEKNKASIKQMLQS